MQPHGGPVLNHHDAHGGILGPEWDHHGQAKMPRQLRHVRARRRQQPGGSSAVPIQLLAPVEQSQSRGRCTSVR